MIYQIWLEDRLLGESEGVNFTQACAKFFELDEDFDPVSLTFYDLKLTKEKTK